MEEKTAFIIGRKRHWHRNNLRNVQDPYEDHLKAFLRDTKSLNKWECSTYINLSAFSKINLSI